MKKTKTMRRVLLALLATLFALTLSFAVARVVPARAAEPVQVTIYADANGKVEYAVSNNQTAEGLTYTPVEAGGTSDPITISEGQFLHLKATATDAESYLFQYWTTASVSSPSAIVSSAVSIKSQDVFSYEELKSQNISDLYANFTKKLDDADKANANALLKISYDENLGDVYVFMGSQTATEDIIKSHGIRIDPNEAFEIPYAIRQTKNTNYYYHNLSFLAVPKEEIASSLKDGTASVIFNGWKASYYEYGTSEHGKVDILSVAKHENTEVPYYCNETGSWTADVGALWRANGSISSDYTDKGILRLQRDPTLSGAANYWHTSASAGSYVDFEYLYIDKSSIFADFHEVAPVPTMHITPTVNGEQQDTIDSTDRETTVSMQYSESNSMKVLLDAFSGIDKTEQHYTIFVEGARDLSTGNRTTKPITGEWIGDQFGFNVPDLMANSDIIITPDYGTGYFTEPITIHVNLTATEDSQEALNTIVSSESADITVLNDDEANQWYFDPQFNGSGSNAFLSGLSYPSDALDEGSMTASQIHFQVKGSGVFAFDFYLDGYSVQPDATRLEFENFYSLAILFTGPGFNMEQQEAMSFLAAGGSTFAYIDVGLKHRESVIFDTTRVSQTLNKDGWLRALIQVNAADDDAVTDLCLVHLLLGNRASSVSDMLPLTVMAVRNVAFYQGACDVDWGIYGNQGNEKDGYGTVSAKIGENALEGSEQKNVQPGTQIEFTAKTTGEGYQFYGWSDGENLLSTNETFTYTVHGAAGQTTAMHIYAVIEKKDGYAFRNGGKFYKENELQNALDGATKIPQIYVLKSVNVEGTFDIPANVDLIVPYNADGEYFGCAPSDQSSASTTNSTQFSWHTENNFKTPFITFTFDGTMNLMGTFRIGAVMNYPTQGMQGHTSGAYSQFINNGTVNVKDRGLMDIYGLVTGTGSFEVQANGNLAEPFLILDYAGGTNTFGLYSDKQTPFNRYAMVNVQCEGGITVDYQGQLIGHASLYAMSSFFFAEAPVISYNLGESDKGAAARGLITLTSGGKAVIKYTEENKLSNDGNCTSWIGKTELTLSGGATANHMSLDVGIKISTEDVQAFAIPYNYDIKLEDGKFAINGNFKLMPGASLTVGQGATLDLNADFYVYDGFKQSDMSGKVYPSSNDLQTAGYKPNANFIVNGTFNINAGATFMGVVQTNYDDANSPAKIVVAADAASLGGEVTDGALTGYDCNVVKFTSSARVWDAVHNCLGDLEKGKTYTAQSNTTFTLPAVALKYARNLQQGEEADGDLAGSTDGESTRPGHKWDTFNTPSVSGMVGSWKVEHGTNHKEPEWVYDAQKDGTVDPNGVKQLTRYCTELGCDEEFHRYLVGTPTDSIGSFTYRGGQFTEAELAKLFENYFTELNGLNAFPSDIVTASGDLANEINVTAEGYTVTITLSDAAGGGFFLVGNKFENVLTEVKWTITPFDIGVSGHATVDSKEYKGESMQLAGKTYNGSEQKVTPEINVKLDGTTSTNLTAESYKISYSEDTTNVGTVQVTITGTGNYTGTIELTYQITAKEVTLTLDVQKATYSGTMPAVSSSAYTVDAGTKELFEKDLAKGMTVSIVFADGTEPWNAGKYDLKAELGGTGAGNYTLHADGTQKFEIEKASVTVTVKAQHKTYNGGAQQYDDSGWTADGLVNGEQTGVLNVTLNATGTDAQSYDVTASYSSQNYAVTFKGEGGLQAEGTTIKGAFVIDPLDITTGTNIAVAECTYNGEAQQPTLTVTKNGLTVTYIAKYSNNTNAGMDATVEVTGNGNFTGTASTTFEIEKAQVEIAAGNKNSPEGQALVELTYTITGYFEEEGTLRAALKISVAEGAASGKANDEFSITVAFEEGKSERDFPNYTFKFTNGKYKITAAVFANVTFANGSAVYDRTAHEHKATLEQPTDKAGTFSESYSYAIKDGEPVQEMKDVGTYTVTLELTFTASENESETYTTKLTSEYTITAAQLGTVTVGAGDFTYTGKGIEPTLTVTSKNSLTLEGGEYTVSYGERGNINAGKVTVTVTGTGNFEGTAEASFEIAARDIAGAKISVAVTPEGGFVYNGVAQTPELTVKLTIDGEEVTLTDADYNAAFGSNVSVGHVSVTLTGKTNYKGTMSQEDLFEIKPKEITVNIRAQTFEYAGTSAFTLNNDAWETDGLCGQDAGNKAALKVTLMLVGQDGKWNVGTHKGVIGGAWSNPNYNVTFVKGDLTVTAKEVTVTVADKSSEYGDSYAALTYTVNTPLAEGDEEQALGITLTFAGSEGSVLLTPGSYSITGTAEPANGNYKVTFQSADGGSANGTYTVGKRHITVTILDQTETYNNEEFAVPQEQGTGWKVEADAIVGSDLLGITLTKETGKAAGTYEITGTATNDRYTVEWFKGTFTVERRAVTVEIRDQGATYDPETAQVHGYAFDAVAWAIVERAGDGLAESETSEVLGIVLTVAGKAAAETLGNAGAYAITGDWENKTNYNVTFEGSYAGEEYAGKAGTYTIEKLDVSDAVIYMLLVGEEGNEGTTEETKEGHTVRVKYAGKDLPLKCDATLYMGQLEINLTAKLDHDSITGEGNLTVVVTIEDTNYCGGTKFLVIVTDANGYTEHLKAVLKTLAELVKGLDKAALKAEDYETLVEVYGALESLDAAEREVGAVQLAEYQEYVDAWEELADIDDVLETAEAIADAPIKSLFAAAAMLTALAGLAYIATKGGLL